MNDSTESKAGGNRLAQETSPYLLQHAGNPVDWQPWDEKALAQAEKEQKPIFLSIGYSACHWCHVMEHESFEDPEVANLLNRHFVSIKVDREERPDLDEIYMTAVQMLTGAGGWPMTVFLTPGLQPFFGGTYFPPDDRYGRPGFKNLLERLIDVWANRRDDVVKSAAEITTAIMGQTSAQPPTGQELSVELLERAVRQLHAAHDSRWGGFGGAPKFPPSGAVGLLLREYQAGGEEGLLKMATHTLDQMMQGGLYDQLGGGFHRYSVDEKWLVPHFEKMLYDNALLSQVYLEAFQVTRQESYARIVRETLDYILRDMTDPEGAFHASEDADSEGVEGKFYVWNIDEIQQQLDPADAELFCACYDVTPGGNFEGTSILNLPGSYASLADGHGLSLDGLLGRLQPMREKLLAVRSQRVRPGKDDKIVASWNGLMISSMARAYCVLEEERYLDAARGAARFILEKMAPDNGLLRAYRKGRGRQAGFLDDYVFVASGLLDLFEADVDPAWLDAAVELTREAEKRFWDEQTQSFFFADREQEHLLVRTRPAYDGAEPSGNSMAARLLLRLSRMTGAAELEAKANHLLRTYEPHMRELPRGYLNMLNAVHLVLRRGHEVVVAGRVDDEERSAMLRVARQAYLPSGVVVAWDPAGVAAEHLAARLPVLAGKSPADGSPAAYVCMDFACQAPVDTAAQLTEALRKKPAKDV